MREPAAEAISREEVDGVIREIHHTAEKACGMYARGLLPGEERDERIRHALWTSVGEFFDRNSLRLRVAAGDWPAFLDAVRDWRRDGQESRLQACRWLSFFREDEKRGIRPGDEASTADKLKILELLDACHIPVAYYRPVPEGILCPDEHPAHFPAEYIVGFGIWDRDEGLARGDFRIGGTKTLVDRHGLKTVLKIETHTPEAEQDRYHDADYTGSGTVEGYTTARPREIKVYIDHRKGVVSCLKFFKGEDDFALRFPLWEAYYRDRAEIAKLRDGIIRDLVGGHTPATPG